MDECDAADHHESFAEDVRKGNAMPQPDSRQNGQPGDSIAVTATLGITLVATLRITLVATCVCRS